MNLKHSIFSAIFTIAMLVLNANGVIAQGGDRVILNTDRDRGETMANVFYKDCVARPPFIMGEFETQEFCACSSVQVEIWEKEKINNMPSDILNPVVSRDELTEDVLLVEIFSPCLFVPARERAFIDCYNEEQFTLFNVPHERVEKYCQCVAAGEEEYFAAMAQPYFKLYKQTRHAPIADPIDTMSMNTDYLYEKRDIREECDLLYSPLGD